jgi:hypothetical protein
MPNSFSPFADVASRRQPDPTVHRVSHFRGRRIRGLAQEHDGDGKVVAARRSNRSPQAV